ncbi:alkaline phosphatase family protein [Nocardioides acrostichi]|uniref:Alkaline phosphatase family protein n=1 Tax=Nocardioides acrostichi TaxID=2784339 RepID=A0A930YBZ2_9ACTN|nr:nucleotide pyrophosphatase/phosphodiesterase family protein [Nocardioides acrostichi]MBF4160959.1 alkaline phosphatase family protein [Nocardioides acrostichi]
MTGFVEPAYGTASLADVVPGVAAALGRPLAGLTEGPTEGLLLPSADSYVVLLVDGLGARLLERYRHVAPFLASMRSVAPSATAGVPSTTATSLTSFGTGLVPGHHGVVGFTSRLPGTDRLLVALTWDKSVDPEEWQPHPTALARLAAQGVEVSVVNKREFRDSGLTRAAARGADYVGADRVGERIAAAVTGAGRTPSLTYLYDPDLDWTGHQHGVASPQWLQQLAMIDHEAEQLRDALPASTRLLIVADHGMVDVPPTARVDVDQVDELRDGVSLLGGEARFRHLYCSRGAVDDVVATWRSVLGERADVLTRDEAVARGWFGPVESRVVPRLGDVMVACRDETAVLSTRSWAYEATLIGMHGSLTAEEMLIPLLVG